MNVHILYRNVYILYTQHTYIVQVRMSSSYLVINYIG